MPAITSTPLSAAQIQTALQQANTIGGAGTNALRQGQFVLLAAFDGSN
jgi:hypothetical protein